MNADRAEESRRAGASAFVMPIVVDIDRVFDVLPVRDAWMIPLAEAGAAHWRPVFLGAPVLTVVARVAPFATLSALAPDEPEAPPVLGQLPRSGGPDMPRQRSWAVMTYGFATEHAAARAAIAWSVALAEATESEPGDMLTFLRAQEFPADWRGFA